MKLKILIFLTMLSFNFYLFSADENLEKLLKESLEANPGISAIEYQIKALQEKEIFVQKLMDPMIAIEYSNVPFESWKLDESAMSGIQFKLMQTVPFPGKNSKRKAVAQSEKQVKNWELEELKLQLSGEIKKAYYQLGLNRKLKANSVKHIKLLEDLIEAIIHKYETGKSAQSDILQMTLMKDKLQDDLEDFKLKEKEIQAILNSILNGDINTFISTKSVESDLNMEFDFDTLLEIAKQNNPLLKKINEMSKMKRLSFLQAKSERLPDITLWIGYRYRKDVGMMKNEDLVSVGFSFPIPLDLKGRTKAKMNNAKFMEKTVDENYKNTFNKISEMILAATSGLERTKNKINNYQDNLIPDAERIFRSVLTSYETGRANFADLYQSQLQLIQFEKILINSKYKYKIYETTIGILVGGK